MAQQSPSISCARFLSSLSTFCSKLGGVTLLLVCLSLSSLNWGPSAAALNFDDSVFTRKIAHLELCLLLIQ